MQSSIAILTKRKQILTITKVESIKHPTNKHFKKKEIRKERKRAQV